MWSADGKSLFYVSDRTGPPNIWTMTIGGGERQVTQFKDGRVLWPTISYDGRTIVFERDFEVWSVETASGRAARIPIARRGAPSAPSTEHVTLTTGFQDLLLSRPTVARSYSPPAVSCGRPARATAGTLCA